MDQPWMGVLEDCNVRYRGRAKADQTGGTLAVLVKEDGVVLAHRLEADVSPQFYNPAGDVSTWTRLDRLYLRSESEGGEVLKINGLPRFVREAGGGDGPGRPARRYKEGLENDVASWIQGEPEVVGLGGRDATREEDRIGGRVDLMFDDGTVVEVKRSATVSAHDQASRYLRDPSVREVVVACFSASDNLREACERSDGIRVLELERDAFREWLD